MEQKDICGLHVLSAQTVRRIEKRANVSYDEMSRKIPGKVLKHETTSDVLYGHA